MRPPWTAVYEIVYVNDGSRDHTPDILNDLAAHDPCVRAVHFARNAGHQMAVTAGLDYATGDAIVIIDADLQDPPEIIPEMAAKWRAGAQVVYGQRNRRAGESAFKKFTAFAYYRLLRAMTSTDIPADTGDFRLVDRQVADVVRRMPEHARFLRGMFAWVGFRQEPCATTAISASRAKRIIRSKKCSSLRWTACSAFRISCSSSFPCWASACWPSAAWGCWALLILLCCGVQAGAWWLAALMVLCTGTVTTGLGILGAYISRIYDETRARPLYIVGETRGFPGGFYTLPPINYHHGGSYGNQGNEHPRSTLA